jgi:hypothetical protein
VNHALEGLGFRKILINSSLIVIIMVEQRGGKSDKFEGDLGRKGVIVIFTI